MNDTETQTRLEDLCAAATCPSISDQAFAETMFSTLKDLIPFDSATLNLCKVERGFRLPELKSHLFRQPDSMESNYQNTSHVDPFSPNLLRYLGKTFDALQYVDIDAYPHSPIYLHHCRYFDVENALAVAGRMPGHLRWYWMLYLFSANPRAFFPTQAIDVLDQWFPALFSMWQYRLGLICADTLANRIQLLLLFRRRPRLYQLVRLIVQNPLGTAKEYAQEMGCSERTVEHRLNQLYEQLEIAGYGKNKKIALYRRFRFLE